MTKRINGYYAKDGLHYPSATTVIRSASDSFGLMRWAIGQGACALHNEWSNGRGPKTYDHAKEVAIEGYETELDRTANYGSNVHMMVERHLLGKNLPQGFVANDKENTALKTITGFLHQAAWKHDYIESEVFVDSPYQHGSHNTRIAGRLDLCSIVDNPGLVSTYLKRSSNPLTKGRYVIDFKTGSFYKDSIGMQLSIYAVGVYQTFNEEVDGGIVVHCERERPDKVTLYVFTKDQLNKYYMKNVRAVYNNWVVNLSPKWWRKEQGLED